jgi:hypothetical protein
MKLVHLTPGDEVYLQVNPDLEGTLLVVPVEVATRWFEAGRRADQKASERPQHDKTPP